MAKFKMPFEIMFNDLTPEAQRQFLKWADMKSPKEGNFDVFCIAEIPPIID